MPNQYTFRCVRCQRTRLRASDSSPRYLSGSTRPFCAHCDIASTARANIEQMPTPPQEERRESVSHTKFNNPMVKERVCVKCETRDYRADPIPTVCQWCSGPVEETGNEVIFAWAPNKNQLRINKSRRLIGFEVELDRATDGLAIDNATKALKGGHYSDGTCGSGLEICTAPAGGDLLIEKITAFSKAIRAGGALCGKAIGGAGLHTHVDCRDMSYHDMRKIAIVYSRLEPAIYSILPPSRITGTYSKPLGPGLAESLSDPSTARKDFQMLVEGDAGRAMARLSKRPLGEGGRYLGANFHSWFLRGTIEFRLHQGTTKWEKMIPFGLLLSSMCERAVAMKEKDLWRFPVGRKGLHFISPDIGLQISTVDMATQVSKVTGLPFDPKKDGVRQWVENRWDFFSKGRKSPNEPVLKY